MKVQLDGRQMTDRETAHTYLAEQLQFPSYYGRNLDALYDLLTERGEPLEILFTHTEQMKEQMGSYGSTLLHTMMEAENDNLALTVTVC